MILTNCAACAAPLAHDAPTHCVRCNTRYCSDRCLRYHSHMALYKDDGATLEDLREVVTMLEDAERTARRVLGGTHPLTSQIEQHLRNARDTLRERETSSGMATRTRAARARPTEEK